MANFKNKHIIFMPLDARWGMQELKMFDVFAPRISRLIHQMPLPDLLLAAYLMGLNDMQEVLDKETP